MRSKTRADSPRTILVSRCRMLGYLADKMKTGKGNGAGAWESGEDEASGAVGRALRGSAASGVGLWLNDAVLRATASSDGCASPGTSVKSLGSFQADGRRAERANIRPIRKGRANF